MNPIKKLFTNWILLILFFFSDIPLAAADHFEGFSWGTPRAKIEEKITNPTIRSKELLMALKELASYNVSYGFRFDEKNNLNAGLYVASLDSEGQFVSRKDFEHFKKYCVKAYGKPKFEIWEDKSSQDTKLGQWDQAKKKVALDYFRKFGKGIQGGAAWELQEKGTVVTLYFNRVEKTVAIVYTPLR